MTPDNSDLRIPDLLDLTETEHAVLFDGCSFAWEVLPRIPGYVLQHTSAPKQEHTVLGNAYIADQVCIGQGTVVENGATIKGPTIIGENCRIGPGAYIRENVIIGNQCIVGNSVEIKHALLFNGCQVPHYNYVGESVLGYKAHLGAGAICSNWKLMPSPVVIRYKDAEYETHLMKLGAILGDRAEVGCNAVCNPGSVIGRDAVVYSGINWRGVLPNRAIAKLRQEHVLVDRRKDS